jgi:hypothetical protein
MSFDLAVWHSASQFTADAAEEKYRQLCDTRGTAGGPVVAAFHHALVEHYPEGPESPWSSGLAVTTDAIVMSIVWPRAKEVLTFVLDLAERHGLVCFNPQEGVVHHPPALRAEPELTLHLWDGTRIENPDLGKTERSLRKLSRSSYFVILERADEHYVQVGYGEDAGTLPGWYALERRDGSADRHYRCVVTDISEIIKAFTGFQTEEPAWEQRFGWQKVEF